jgi:hypothetical protein
MGLEEEKERHRGHFGVQDEGDISIFDILPLILKSTTEKHTLF